MCTRRFRQLSVPFLGAILIAGAAYPAGETSNWSLAQKEQFLLTADIGTGEYAGKGITHSEKTMFTEDGITHAAHIQTIDVYMPLFKGKDGSKEQDFKDSWKFNVAAYRLAKMLNLTDMVPVCVPRVIDGKPSAVDWWVDDVLMDERDRITKNIQPPDAARWKGQKDSIRVFDQLIYNMDRSQENLLITTNWDVWMIDHSRTFRKWTSLRNPAAITRCRPDLLKALKKLRRDDVTAQLTPYVTDEEINGLMVRRDLIVAKLEGHGDGTTTSDGLTPPAVSPTKTTKK
jgi:hypothetical protein